ncbi:YfjI family protein [Pseudomonas sp. EpS/L25]|uniref:YfjI family protein n=1 Tax=Pseudomonas sp. EpS/L25 TaxID=1749078 RepID=UPI0013663282|nr:YfjI family protein [Pseudomonas sp. EpS/L25]
MSSGVSVADDEWPRFREHSTLDAAVREAVRELQISSEMAYMCALGAITTACHGRIDLEMPPGYQTPTSLMLLTIADSGERKTATQDYFFSRIHELDNSARRADESAANDYRIKLQIWHTKKRQLEREYNKFTSKDKTIAQIALTTLEEHLKSEPKLERSGAFLYEDTTPQALVQMLDSHNPYGCLLTSEANSIFNGKALGELDKLNTLWDGGTVNIGRITRGNINLEGARLTLSIMAQPSVISRFMAKRGEEARGTGFLARFLVAKPRSMAGNRISKTNQKQEKIRHQQFNNKIENCIQSSTKTNRQVLRFSEPAVDFWHKCEEQLEEEMRENGLHQFSKDHASKLLENASRLSANLHAFERDRDEDIEIELATLEFCWKFARICSKHFLKHLAGEPQLVTDTESLVQHLIKNFPLRVYRQESYDSNQNQSVSMPEQPPPYLENGERYTFSLSDIKQKGPSKLRGIAGNDRLEAALSLLTKLGHLKRERNRYTFKETILLKSEPEMKNGEAITIKSLPLFKEQEYWRPKRQTGLLDNSGYYFIKSNR